MRAARESPARAAERPAAASRARPVLELVLVLGTSLGESSVYAIVALADALTRAPLSSQTTTLNPSQSDRAVFDLIYQVLGAVFPLVPVALALLLLGAGAGGGIGTGSRMIGLDARRPRFDLGLGALLFVGIGVPGIALYLAALQLDLGVHIDTDGLSGAWYTVPVLLLSALRSALQEEVLVVGYLFTRLEQARWRPWAILVASALFRGSYHLYQGFGGFVGNAVMGVVFGLLYRRFGRVGPLVVAHFLLDAASFLGYGLAKSLFPALHF